MSSALCRLRGLVFAAACVGCGDDEKTDT